MRNASVSKISKSEDRVTKKLISKQSFVYFVIRDITIVSTLLVTSGRHFEQHTCVILSEFQLPLTFLFKFSATELRNWLKSWHCLTVKFGFDLDSFLVRRLNLSKKYIFFICLWQQLVFENVSKIFHSSLFTAQYRSLFSSELSILYFSIQKTFLSDKFWIWLSTQFLLCPGVLIVSGINMFTTSWIFKFRCSKHECISFVSNSFFVFCSLENV